MVAVRWPACARRPRWPGSSRNLSMAVASASAPGPFDEEVQDLSAPDPGEDGEGEEFVAARETETVNRTVATASGDLTITAEAPSTRWPATSSNSPSG